MEWTSFICGTEHGDTNWELREMGPLLRDDIIKVEQLIEKHIASKVSIIFQKSN
jgi:hypothetical protein